MAKKKSLRAVHHNWGECVIGDWSATYYTLYDDKTLRVDKRYSRLPSEKRGKMELSFRKLSANEFDTLEELITSKISQAETHHFACDGSAWEMEIFDEEGKIAHKIPLGYIYGDPILEKITDILVGREED